MQNNRRIESQVEVQAFLQDLQYALKNGAEVILSPLNRRVDQNRDEKFTNRYTLADLFPGENPADAMRRELLKLTIQDYIATVKDIRFPKKSEMREFGKVYEQKGDVYIKVRVDLLGANGRHSTFVMSFHYAERPFQDDVFPYRE